MTLIWLALTMLLPSEMVINIHAADKGGYTALHHAARRGTNVLLLLLNAGSAPTRTNNYGKSPIDLASNPDKRELLRRFAVRQSVQDGIDEPRTMLESAIGVKPEMPGELRP